MKCHNCGFELSPGAKFCGECGTKVIPQDNTNQAPIQQQTFYNDQPTVVQDSPTAQSPSFTPIPPQPVAEPIPEPIPVPQPVAEPIPQPMPFPQPVAEPVPEPLPVPQPVAEPVPEPIPVPQPVAEPVPQPIPVPQPVSEPIPQPMPVPQPMVMPKVKKKNKKSKLWLIILLCIVIVAAAAIVGFFLLKSPSFSSNPAEYTYNLFESTRDDLWDDLDTAEDNLFGFDVSSDEPFTLNLEYSYSDDYWEENDYMKFSFANDPGDEELRLSVAGNDSYDSFSFESFINNDYLGFRLPGVHSNFIVAPSKDFGEELLDSDGYLSNNLNGINSNGGAAMQISVLYVLKNMLEDVDLSYTSIVEFLQSNTEFADEVYDISSKEIIALLEKSNIGDRTDVQYAFDNGTVNAQSYDIQIQTSDLIDAYYNIFNGIKNSKVTKDILGDDLSSMLGMMLPNRKDLDTSELPAITLKLVEYDGRLVEVTVLFGLKDEETTQNGKITIKSTDKNSLLGGIKLIIDSDYSTSEDGYEWENNSSTILGFTSNWLTEDEKISAKFYGNSFREYYNNYDGEEYSDSFESSAESGIDFDFDNGTWYAYTLINGEITDSITGTCSNDDGFNFSLNYDDSHEYYDYDYSMDYEEWLEDKFEDLKSSYRRSLYYDSSYDDYAEWYVDNADYYDAHHYTFEEWLEDYYDEDPYDMYHDEAYEEYVYMSDVSYGLSLNLTDEAGVDFDDRDYDNIFEWDESDFRNFIRLVENVY